MLASILRLFALRPLFSIMIFGFPLLLLLAIGLFAVVVFKAIFFVVLPIALVIWVVRKLVRSSDPSHR